MSGRQRAVLAGDDFDQQFAADAAGCVVEAKQLALLALLQLLRVIRVVEAQALDGVPDRPFDELRAEASAVLEIERARARQLDRPADPERMVGGAKQSLAAIGAVDQHAEAGPAIRHPGGGLHGQDLEVGDALGRRADLLRHGFELNAMVDGKRHQRLGLPDGASLPSGCG